MLHIGTQKLFDYWNKLRGENTAPSRVEIAPASISTILPSTFILQSNGSNDFEFRIAGTAVCLLYNQELKSKCFIDLFDEDDRKLAKKLLHTVHCERACLILNIEVTASNGQQAQAEVMVLPLSDEKPRLLGSLHVLDMPYWIGTEKINATTIQSVRLLDANKDLIFLQNRPALTMMPRLKDMQAKSNKRRLALIDGGIKDNKSSNKPAIQRKIHQPFVVLQGGLSK